MVNEWRVYEAINKQAEEGEEEEEGRTLHSVKLPRGGSGIRGFPAARFDLDHGRSEQSGGGGGGDCLLPAASSSSQQQQNKQAMRVLAMQALGPDLGAVLQLSRSGRLGLKSVLCLGEQMVDLLRELHQSGWAHRDVKPENFCVGKASASASSTAASSAASSSASSSAAQSGSNSQSSQSNPVSSGGSSGADASAKLYLIDFGVATPLPDASPSFSISGAPGDGDSSRSRGDGGGGGGGSSPSLTDVSGGGGGGDPSDDCSFDGWNNEVGAAATASAAVKGALRNGGGDSGGVMVGSVRYLSARAHERSPLVGALDDLESACFVLLWLFRGGQLPWQGLPLPPLPPPPNWVHSWRGCRQLC